jgi:hypothetical protein
MKREKPPDPARIDELRREIEADLARLRAPVETNGPTLDMIASKLDELISIAKALEARGQQVSPKMKVALWHLGASITTEIIKRIVSAAHNCLQLALWGLPHSTDEPRTHARRRHSRITNDQRHEATRFGFGTKRESYLLISP